MRGVPVECRVRNRRTDLRPGRFQLPRRLHEQRRLPDVGTLLRHHVVIVRPVSERHSVRRDSDAFLQRRRPVRGLRERHELPDDGAVLPGIGLRAVQEQARLSGERTFLHGGRVPLGERLVTPSFGRKPHRSRAGPRREGLALPLGHPSEKRIPAKLDPVSGPDDHFVGDSTRRDPMA